VPGVADWKTMHRPYLEKARALIIVCTPGARLNEGPGDWVHQEIDWWLAHRDVAPILVDPLMEGLRYVPSQVARRWPDIQRISLVEKEWGALSETALLQKAEAVRRQIIGTLLPSGAAVYAQELAIERQRAQRLRRALVGVVALLGAVAGAGGYALNRQKAALRNERIASASLLDTRAASAFGESRLIDVRWELELTRRRDILERIRSAGAAGVRAANLRHELQQLEADVAALERRSKEALVNGRELLERADREWQALADAGLRVERTRPAPPYVLSVELVNAGAGESILLHYGTPDDIRLVMINAGPRRTFQASIASRLRQLSTDRFDRQPVPIELFIVGDRDEDKTGGLERLLSGLADPAPKDGKLVEFRGIWANIFRVEAGERETLRSRIRRLIHDLGIPLNKPFDRHLVRPTRGRAVVSLYGGLEVVVLGPDQSRVHALHQMSAREASQAGGIIEPFVAETFREVKVETAPAPLSVAGEQPQPPGDCADSENARASAGGAYADTSVANLASTILLFRFRGSTFLYTGDARGDFILEGLSAAGLLDENGQATVDLMTIPHLGSDRNVTVDFFRQVRASGYLFSGDGTHGNPEVRTVASLVTARGCDAYRMYFVNRDGSENARRESTVSTPDSSRVDPDDAISSDTTADDTHGAKLDAFFREEERFHPNYRRVFRSSAGGSVIIDLLTPVRR
jgi:hypothetical protein